MNSSHQDIINFIRQLYPAQESIPLHEPHFTGNEKKYVLDCIDSTYVSSIGSYVTRFEQMVAEFTGAQFAVATVNGTAALHVALKIAGVGAGDEVITQPLTFIATCNAVSYCGATPVFVDVNRSTLGMNPTSLLNFLKEHTTQTDAGCINKLTGKKITAVLPMHTFGLPCQIDEIARICHQFQLPLVEDAAEGLGSFYQGKHTGTVGDLGTLSFNGNKPITTGGGGMILTNNFEYAQRAKHISTTAKIPHHYEFVHDELGYNYRLPNLNAALGCAQMESLPAILKSKRSVANAYQDFFKDSPWQWIGESAQASSNYWLNAIIANDKQERNTLLAILNEAHIMSRPIWRLINELPMYRLCQTTDLSNARWLEERVINLPSSAK